MKLDPQQVKTVAQALHQGRYPRYKYGKVICAGPSICCGQCFQMARALLRQFDVFPKMYPKRPR